MPTWQEAQGHLRGKYRLSRDGPDWLGLEWQFDLDGQTETQRLKIERTTAFDRPWVLSSR